MKTLAAVVAFGIWLALSPVVLLLFVAGVVLSGGKEDRA
jgi:hypothetical protein